MKSLSKIIDSRIEGYNAKGSLGHTAKIYLTLAEVYHASTKAHTQRVALLAEATAKKLKKDVKAAFFAGLLHDFGKILLPSELFDGHNITPDEYARVKQHAQAGFLALKKLHCFTALCAGLHHALYQAGYGATTEDLPRQWSPSTVKKVLEISTIISICDFVDAYTHRATKILDGSGTEPSLKEMLYKKYQDDHQTVDVVLSLH